MLKITELLKENLAMLKTLKNENIKCRRYENEFQHRLSRLIKEVVDFILVNDKSDSIQINTNNDFSLDKMINSN